MRNLWKHLIIIVPVVLAIFFISFAFEDKTKTEYRTVYETQPLVYVTKTGDCYHSGDCHHLSRSAYPKGLYQAQNSGYRACNTCGGRSYSTIQVQRQEPYEVEYYAYAIFFSVAKVVFIAPVICIPIIRLLERTKYFDEDDGLQIEESDEDIMGE